MFYSVTSIVALSIATLASVTPAQTAGPAREVSIQAKIPRGGDFMGFGFDSLWMMSGSGLARVNPSDNSVIDIVVEGAVGQYREIAIGEGAVWVPDTGSSTIYKVDPQKNQVITKIKISAGLFDSEGSIGVGEGSVWAITGFTAKDSLTRYNAESGAEEAKISLPSAGSGVIVDFGSVWVTGPGHNELYRVDPKSNHIVATISLGPHPRFVASGEGSVWVLNQGDGTVQRIDGKSGQVVATIEADAAGSGGDISVGGGFVWVTTGSLPVIQIDPRTNSLRGKFTAPSGVYLGDAIRYGSGSLWVSGPSVFRIKPPE